MLVSPHNALPTWTNDLSRRISENVFQCAINRHVKIGEKIEYVINKYKFLLSLDKLCTINFYCISFALYIYFIYYNLLFLK
jgi:hypothetical protein